jgi:uncharacterized protein (TIGR00369 family)
METEAVRQLVEELIPFVKKAGITVEELTSTKVRLRVPHEPTNLSPMGTLHAGALFTAAETCAATLCFVSLGESVMVVAKAGDIRFRRPGRGDVLALAQMTPVEAQKLLDGVQRDGKLDAQVVVELADAGGEPVATSTVTLSLRRA